MQYKPQGKPTLHSGKTPAGRPTLQDGRKPASQPNSRKIGGCKSCKGGRR